MKRNLVLLVSVVWLLLGVPVTQGQTEPPPQDDVVRVFTQLVQTDLMVFDRKGHFVNGLKREDFELKVDGKTTPIEFLDYVVAGSAREEAQLTAARSDRTLSVPANVLERGRTVLFYVDDLHLDLASCDAARRMTAKFLDRNMAYNTEAAITSTSGQIGFLQQLTDSDLMLRAALRRLNPKPYSVEDGILPRMTEHQALVLDRRDPELTGFFIDETIRMARGMNRDTAAAIVSQRAGNTLFRAEQATRNTLTGLENLLAYANKTPGRKLLIFISGGFVMDLLNTREAEIVRRISSAAARSGVVVYSVDARGLTTTIRDASSGGSGSDPMQRLERSMRSEVWDTQDIMSTLAKDTGGKTVFNTNDLTSGLQDALQETSVYYLLGWKPDSQSTAPGKFQKLTASVIGRPDLTVRIRRGFAAGEPLPVAAKTKGPKTPPPSGPEAELQKAMLAPLPGKNTPVSIALNYANTADKGLTLSTSLQIDRDFVSIDSDDKEKQNGTLEVLGTIYDDHGRAGARINDRLTVTPATGNDAASANAIVATYPIRIRPGLYQVRVAVRDPKSGRVGNTNAWVEVPDLLAPKLVLSSLMIGERKQPSSMRRIAQTEIAEGVNLNVKFRFSPNSQLRFLVFAYNAKSPVGTAFPDVAIQIQILRNGQAVVSPPLRTIATQGAADLKRLPYAAELSLEGLERGHYQLWVVVFDRVAKTSASEQRAFEIE